MFLSLFLHIFVVYISFPLCNYTHTLVVGDVSVSLYSTTMNMEDSDAHIDLDFSLKTIFSDFSLNDLDLLV